MPDRPGAGRTLRSGRKPSTMDAFEACLRFCTCGTCLGRVVDVSWTVDDGGLPPLLHRVEPRDQLGDVALGELTQRLELLRPLDRRLVKVGKIVRAEHLQGGEGEARDAMRDGSGRCAGRWLGRVYEAAPTPCGMAAGSVQGGG